MVRDLVFGICLFFGPFLDRPETPMGKRTDRMGPERPLEAGSHGFIAPGVAQEEAPAVCLRGRKTLTPPLLNRPVKAKEIVDPVLLGEGLFPVRTIKIDQKRLAV